MSKILGNEEGGLGDSSLLSRCIPESEFYNLSFIFFVQYVVLEHCRYVILAVQTSTVSAREVRAREREREEFTHGREPFLRVDDQETSFAHSTISYAGQLEFDVGSLNDLRRRVE